MNYQKTQARFNQMSQLTQPQKPSQPEPKINTDRAEKHTRLHEQRPTIPIDSKSLFCHIGFN